MFFSKYYNHIEIKYKCFFVLLSLLIIVMLSCFVVYYVIPISWIPNNLLTVTVFEKWINDDIPIGSTRSDVENWLRLHNIHYNDILDIKTSRKVGVGSVIYRHNIISGLNTRLEACFYFDENDILTNYMIREHTISF